jgi:beta-glucosidase
METYGEDPYLTGELAVPMIKGMQGDDPKYLKIVATAKHFIVHSGPEPTRLSFNSKPSYRDFAMTYAPHFKKAVQEGGVWSVMCAYNRYNDEPCCGNKYLDNLLRNDWGFKGYVVSDCGALKTFYQKGHHEVVETGAQAAAMGLTAGTDLNCGDTYKNFLKESVEKGYLIEKEIDVSVERLMEARLRLGLFAPKGDVKYENIPFSVVDSKQNQQLALEAAQKSIVLLKNNGILPLSKKTKRIAIIGPNANNIESLLANYNGFPSNPITPLKGILAKVPNAKVEYAIGTHLVPQLPLLEAVPANIFYTDKSLKTKGIAAKYFNNSSFSGNPYAERIDPNIDFEWSNNAPVKGMNYLKYSVVWEGYIVPKETGEYAFGGEGYPKIKIMLDEVELFNFSNDWEPQLLSKTVKFKAGEPRKIRVEMIQNDTENPIARLLWERQDLDFQQNALNIAKKADVVIMCMGLSPRLEGETLKIKLEGFNGGDRTTLDLPKNQQELIKAVQALGKPVVLVLLNGSAVSVNWEQENLPAIVEAWYPGQAGGQAIADVLFGDVNPSGRLPLTFYKNVNEISGIENYNMEGKTYRYFAGKPLYEFGFGLSYSTFEYSDLKLQPTANVKDVIKVQATVKNTGKVTGDEIVQLYSSRLKAPYPDAIRTLQGFTRVTLKAGESKVVSFEIKPEQLSLVDDNDQMVNPAGELVISIGGKQPDVDAIKEKKTVESSIKLNRW